MTECKTLFYKSESALDVEYYLKNVSEIEVAGGCTELCRNQGGKYFSLPKSIVSLRNVADFCGVSRTERMLEIGAGTTLSAIEDLHDADKIPKILSLAIKTVATPAIRNFATIGGNVCSLGFRKTLFAPLLVLNAALDFHGESDLHSVPIAKLQQYFGQILPEAGLHEFFPDVAGMKKSFDAGKKRIFLTKIKIPIVNWTGEFFCRIPDIAPQNTFGLSCAMIYLCDKSTITDVRIACAGSFTIRSTTLENVLIGVELPASLRVIQNFVGIAEDVFDATMREMNMPESELVLKTRSRIVNFFANSIKKMKPQADSNAIMNEIFSN